MAEPLYFPIGFDLEGGAETAIADWNKVYQDKIAESIAKNPIAIKLKISKESLGSLEDVKAALKELKIEPITPETKASIQSLAQELKQLERILIGIDKYNARYAKNATRSMSSLALEWQRVARAAKADAATQKERALTEAATARADATRALEKQRLLKIEATELKMAEKKLGLTRSQTSAYSAQSNVLRNLTAHVSAYSAIFMGFRFLENIRSTTAEFELQQVALTALLRDGEAAAETFERIKVASVESPFEVKELVSFTKQLAAYNVEADSLFDTMMQLADISAGLGVGMDRLVLAYGQVKSAAVLRGTELRQFTEAGIPLVQMLADKFTELRGEMVTTAEVFDLISDRAVSFEMVADLFDEMTSAGGMFYDMQAKQSATLAGQWTNLKDAIALAYDEMGRSDFATYAFEAVASSLKSLAENWRAVGNLATAAASALVVYKIAMANATIAAKALSKAEFEKNVITTAQLNIAPKIVAKMIGQANAYKLSILLSKQLYKARIAEATATGLLSKAWARLKVVMLSNPWALALAGITALVTGIGLFITRSETAEERAKGLNKAIANLEDSRKKLVLVDEYEQLSKKVSKTKTEQDRLNSVTKELIKAFPLATEGAKEYGDALGVSAEKAKELAVETLKMNKDTLQTLYLIEADNVKKLRDKKMAADKRVAKRNEDYNWARENSATPERLALLGDRQREAIEEVDELSAELAKAEENYNRLGVALGYVKDETTVAIEEFGKWKKTLSEATVSYTDATEVFKNKPLFDKETIKNAESLDDILDKAAEGYKKASADITSYSNKVNSAIAAENESQKKDFERLRDNAESMKDAYYEVLKNYNALDKLSSKSEVNQAENERVAALKKQVELLEQIYKRYQEIRKYKSAEEAETMVREEFAGSIAKLRVEPAFDSQSLRNSLLQFSREASRLGDDQLAIEIGFKADDAAWDAFVEDTKSRVASLQERIERESKAQDFFSKMLGLTGDRDLTASITMSVFGSTGDDLANSMVQQVKEAFAGIDISDAVDGLSIDYDKLAKHIPEVAEAQRDTAKKIVDNWRETNANIITDLYESYEKFLTFEERKTRVMEQEAEKRQEIQGAPIPVEQQDKLIKASLNRERQQITDISIEEFKADPDWIRAFEDLDKISSTTIDRLLVKMRDLIETNREASPDQVRALVDEYERLYNVAIERDPFRAIADGLKMYSEASAKKVQADNNLATAKQALDEAEAEYRYHQQNSLGVKVENASRRYEDALAAYKKAQKEASQASDDQAASLDLVTTGFEAASSAAGALGNVVSELIDLFGVAEDSDFGAYLQSLVKTLGVMSSALSLVATIMTIVEKTSKNFLIPVAAVAAAVSAITFFTNAKVRKANEEIERQQDLLDSLSKSYNRLEKSMESAFGTEYIRNYNERLANLYAQQQAYLAQAEAERAKGKKEDEEKTQGYLDSAYEVGEQIADMAKEVSERFAGTDLASAARDFASSWIDAYIEFGNTTDAIRSKFSEMVNNMIVESVAGKIMQQLLSPIFTAIDEYSKDGNLDVNEIADIADLAGGSVEGINASMTNLMERLRAAGLDIRNTSSDLTGISKDISTASEESILGLAAGINTQNFYISQIYNHVSSIDMKLGADTFGTPSIDFQNLITLQNQHLSHLPSIAVNTANTAERCERAAQACERIADSLDRVIKPRGTSATHTVNTSL